MAFMISGSPHQTARLTTRQLMLWVIFCTLPGIAALAYFFGYGVLWQIVLCASSALIIEAACLLMRRRPVLPALLDGSALLTGVLLGVSLPPLAPWWVGLIGCLFAIGIAKQLYGGLGQNPFNPAMIGYVVLLISFPVQMTAWLAPQSLQLVSQELMDSFWVIFSGHNLDGFTNLQLRMTVDGTTMATPLDAMKTLLKQGESVSAISLAPMFGDFAGKGWNWVNVSFLAGGLLLLRRNVIQWHIPVSMLGTLFVCSSIYYLFCNQQAASPVLHLFSGATMLGAFFIATDPVSAATSNQGRLIYGTLIGVLLFVIRTFGGFPDGVAFAVLLANLCAPLLDHFCVPPSYGTQALTTSRNRDVI
ncbi:MAG: electron transport complex subunit RsxD [Vibrionaceae bacterium]